MFNHHVSLLSGNIQRHALVLKLLIILLCTCAVTIKGVLFYRKAKKRKFDICQESWAWMYTAPTSENFCVFHIYSSALDISALCQPLHTHTMYFTAVPVAFTAEHVVQQQQQHRQSPDTRQGETDSTPTNETMQQIQQECSGQCWQKFFDINDYTWDK